MLDFLTGEKLVFSNDVIIKDLADVVYNLFGLRKLTKSVFGGEQCSSGRYRSLVDCKAVCRGYNINGDIAKAIKEIRTESSYQILGYHFCSDVGREVHFLNRSTLTAEAIREVLEAKHINFKVNG